MGETFLDVLKRLKEITRLPSDRKIAEVLGIKPQSLAVFKKAGTVPLKHLRVFAKSQGISLDWLLTGNGPMLTTYEAPGGALGVNDGGGACGDAGDRDITQLLQAAKEVLESNHPIICAALEQNIIAFHYAVQVDRRAGSGPGREHQGKHSLPSIPPEAAEK